MSRLIRVILFLVLTSIIYAGEIRIEPKEYWVEARAWNTPFTSSILIDSSLAASGLSGEIHNQYKNRYEQLLEKFRKELQPSFTTLTPYEQGEFILKWAHSNILGSYIENQTLMDNLIDTGTYNCVSSSILYLILSREAGLITGIIETPDHAFCSVETETGWIDVETTTAYGFDPGVKQEFHQEFEKTGFTYVPPGKYRNRETINDRETVALIFQNRMSLLQKKNLHDQVIGIAVDRWTLSGSEKSRKDMNDSFRNWAATLNNRGSYKIAYDLISEVSEKYDLLNSNRDLLYSLAYNHIIKLTNSKNYNTAKTFLGTTRELLESSDYTELENIIITETLADLVRNGTYNESLPLIREAFKSGSISKSDWQNWITVLHQNKALEISEITGWWDAWKYLKALPDEEKELRGIIKSSGLAHDNWSFEIHNQFADLFNAQDFDRAEQILLDGLLLDPGNRYLSRDLSDLKKIQP
ncbi:MAG: hypothetical protein KAR21_22430 [Spirochaetales bacterium]|nr:hypothetical protein [Spirochaetales bacterium]